MCLADDLAALALRRLGQPALVDQEGGLLLRLADDPLRLFLCLLDDPLALGIDAFRGTDFLGDGDSKLVDETERRILVDDDIRRERQLLAVGDQGLEALDEEDDVDRSALQADVARTIRLAASIACVDAGQGFARTVASARWAAMGTMPETSPPNVAISLTRLELT
jgi:hypothetical protein